MKKILFTILGIAGLSLLIAGVAVPAFAHDTETTGAQGNWNAMHEACEEGDWEAMEALHEEGFRHYTDGDGEQSSWGHWGGMMMGR